MPKVLFEVFYLSKAYKTFKSAIPHASGDLSAISRVSILADRLVERYRVQKHRIVEGGDEIVHLILFAHHSRVIILLVCYFAYL